MKLGPAVNLDEVYQTILPHPLIDPDQFRAFYRGEVNAVRGGDKVSVMAHKLRQVYGGTFYKTFLIGHPGVGKSTEMTRLSHDIADKFRVIRSSAQSDLNAAGFQPFDVLLVMMIKLIEKTADPVAEGGAGKAPSDEILAEITRWFETEKRTYTADVKTEVGADAGFKTSSSPLAKVLGLFANLKGEIKYATDRKREITEYRLNAIASLIALMNRALSECGKLLQKGAGCEWLIIGEDFDKPGIPNALIETLFIEHANIFSDLQAHLIFNIPVALAYSEKQQLLPMPHTCLPDTPVFHQNHTEHLEGRAALRKVLEARILPELFEDGQMDRLIVASGGNLRDLFDMVVEAATTASIRRGNKGPIGKEDVTAAKNEKQSQYLVRLGTSSYDVKELTYDEKAAKLLSIYHYGEHLDNAVPDAALHSLLRARAVQEFNGTRWFGVHPLVVNILQSHGKIKNGKQKIVPGGAI